jgi:Xaa-Pro aminopeptidase
MLLLRILGRHATGAAYVAAKSQFLPTRAFHVSAALRVIDMAKVDTTERLAELRKLMKERNVDIYSRESDWDMRCGG